MAADVLEEEYYNLQEENDRYKKLINHEKDNLVSLDRERTKTPRREVQYSTQGFIDTPSKKMFKRTLCSTVHTEKQQEYQSGVKRLEMYMQGHSTLVEVTGEKELRHIGHLFIQNEQKNFALINYINKLHGRRNELKSSTDTMKACATCTRPQKYTCSTFYIFTCVFVFPSEQHTVPRARQRQTRRAGREPSEGCRGESCCSEPYSQSDVEKHSCLADSLEKQCVLFQETLDRLKEAITVLVSEITQEDAVVTFDNISHFISVLEENITDLLIHANNVKDKQLPPQNLLLANSDLLPEGETGVADLLRSRLSLPDQTENSAMNQPLTNV
ncbi:hypothetical protein PAMA_010300 [Pampus argenteus]